MKQIHDNDLCYLYGDLIQSDHSDVRVDSFVKLMVFFSTDEVRRIEPVSGLPEEGHDVHV